MAVKIATPNGNIENATSVVSEDNAAVTGSGRATDATGAVEYTDDELEALYSQAHHLHQSGMQAKAYDLFSFIASCRPYSPRYCKALGVSLMSNGNYEAAIPVLAAALLHDGGNDIALPVACAECLALTGRKPEACRLFEQARIMLAHQQDLPDSQRLAAHTEAWLKILKEH